MPSHRYTSMETPGLLSGFNSFLGEPSPQSPSFGSRLSLSHTTSLSSPVIWSSPYSMPIDRSERMYGRVRRDEDRGDSTVVKTTWVTPYSKPSYEVKNKMC